MRRPLPQLMAIALLLAAGCAGSPPTTPKGSGSKASPSPAASPSPDASVVPTASPSDQASPAPSPTPTTTTGSPTPSPTPSPSPSVAAAPTLTKIEPAIAGAGTKVTLTGTGFNGTGLQVAFGGVQASDAKASDDKTLTATVPDGAATGEATVTVAGAASKALAFTLTRGAVASVGNFVLDLGTSREVSFTVVDAAGKPIPNVGMVTTVEGKAAIYKDGKIIGIENGSATFVTVAAGVTTKLRVVVQKEATATNLAGTGQAGHLDDKGANAQMNDPADLLLDKDGNLLVLEQGGNDLRKVDLHDATHPVTTLAGDGTGVYKDGAALQAGFNAPGGICQAPDGTIYVADTQTPRIRRLKDGVVDTIAGAGEDGYADGTGTAAKFLDPHGLLYDNHDAAHPALLIADGGNHCIRRLELATNQVTTLAGTPGTAGMTDGPGKTAQFRAPKLMQPDGKGGIIIADTENNRLRRLTFEADGSAKLATLVGTGVADFLDGTLLTSQLHSPYGVAVDAAGNVFFSDADNHRIRMLTPDGFVLSAAGTGTRGFDNGPAQHNATFKGMRGLAVGPDGAIYEADAENNVVRQIK